MSTKTLRKRIALVAVSAMGFGLISTVPASAATIGAVVLAAPTAVVNATVGTPFSIPVSVTTIGADTTAADSLIITPTTDNANIVIGAASLETTIAAANYGVATGWQLAATAAGVIIATAP